MSFVNWMIFGKYHSTKTRKLLCKLQYQKGNRYNFNFENQTSFGVGQLHRKSMEKFPRNIAHAPVIYFSLCQHILCFSWHITNVESRVKSETAIFRSTTRAIEMTHESQKKKTPAKQIELWNWNLQIDNLDFSDTEKLFDERPVVAQIQLYRLIYSWTRLIHNVGEYN